MPSTVSDDIAGKLIELIEIGYDKITQNTRPHLSGIQEAQYRLLFYLSQTSMETMTSLGKMMFISKPYMTVLVDSLTKEGYVERVPDEKDRRVINIRITDGGRLKLKEIRVLIAESITHQIHQVAREDLDELEMAADKIIKICKKYQIR